MARERHSPYWQRRQDRARLASARNGKRPGGKPAGMCHEPGCTEYGLACGVWSEKTSKLFETAHALNAGVVWANGYNLFDPASPFGGIRHSGFGREGGIAGLWAYLGDKS